jgi:hypothetical protein
VTRAGRKGGVSSLQPAILRLRTAIPGGA